MNQQELNNIVNLFSQYTGIVPLDSHILGIKNYLEKYTEQLRQKNIFDSPYKIFLTDKIEFNSFIDAAVVSETYFFREEKQFDFLIKNVFPKYKGSSDGKIKIWSAASASGEEAYSLYLAAKYAGLTPEVRASDINLFSLEKIKDGHYKKSSIRKFDGSKYSFLLNEFITNEGIVFDGDTRSKITTSEINLYDMKSSFNVPKNMDIVFIRNVFIYFEQETKKEILSFITKNCLNPGGYIFVSMNETASIDKSLLPENLERKSEGSVFYFQKRLEK